MTPVAERLSDERIAEMLAANKSASQLSVRSLYAKELVALLTELQHRRAAEAGVWTFCPECGCEDSHAPEGGGNIRFCVGCGQDWHTDISYLDVVAQNLRRLSASPSGVRVKALEWVVFEGGQRAITVCGMYAISPQGHKLTLTGMPGNRFGKFDSFDAAKAAAQADYEARIRSALGEHP